MPPGDAVYIFLYICWLMLKFSHTVPRRGPLRRAKPGQFSPENVCAREGKYRLHPDVVIVIKHLLFYIMQHSENEFCDAECTTYPFSPL